MKGPVLRRESLEQGRGGRVLPFMPPVVPFRVMCPDSRRTPASSSGVAADIGRSYTHPGRRSAPDGQAGVLSSPGYSRVR